MAIRKRWAFLVGINRYADYGSLNYCVDDVLDLEKLLKAASYTVVCLHDRQDQEDSDGKPNPRFPTTINIRGRLKSLCDTILQGPDQGQDDLLLVYFACHGSRTNDDVPRLVARDTQRSLLHEAISIAEIEQRMVESGAGCRMLLLDACHIGLGVGGIRSRGADPVLLKQIHDRAKGYALLTASSDQQDAKEWDGNQHGIFSYYVLSGLSGAADLHGKNYVTVNDLAGYVSLRIQEWAVDHDIEQTPCQRVENNLGGFILIPEECQQQVAQFNPPAPSVSINASAQTIQGRGRSPSQIIECLWSLDYDTQHQTFKTCTPRSRRAAAFVVQAKDRRIQEWLVKRLSKQIPGAPAVFRFDVPAHRMWKTGDFNEVWIDLATNHKIKCPKEPAAVINALVNLYKSKSVILALYGWSAIPSSKKNRSQQLQQQVLNELWRPLVQAIDPLPKKGESRLILFLVEGVDNVADPIASNSDGSDPTIPIRLHPLTAISSDQVATWMEKDAREVLRQFFSKSEIDTLIDEEILEWDPDPVTTLEQICYIFELENGIDNDVIRSQWRLVG